MSHGKLHSEERWREFVNKVRAQGEVWLIGPMANDFPFSLVNSHSPIMGVDGGSQKAESRFYDFTIGDGDSLAAPTTLDWQFPPEKSHSDLALALSKLPSETHTLHLWGFWGGRFDHQMMNIGETHRWLTGRAGRVWFYLNEHERVLGLPAGRSEITHHGTFSLFAPTALEMSISGECRYPLQQGQVAPLSSQLLSNEASGRVTLEASAPYFCYLRTARD